MTPDTWQEVAFLVLAFAVLFNAVNTYKLSRLILWITQRTTTIEITEVWKKPEQTESDETGNS